MANIITGPGEYRTTPPNPLEVVEYVTKNGTTAIGPGGNTWDARTGKSQSPRDWPDILGPYVPPRKRVSGWVNIYDKPSDTHYLWPNQTAADDSQNNGRIACIPVRSYDPEAEKEAREDLEGTADWLEHQSFKASAAQVRRALSLLFPDEAQ